MSDWKLRLYSHWLDVTQSEWLWIFILIGLPFLAWLFGWGSGSFCSSLDISRDC